MSVKVETCSCHKTHRYDHTHHKRPSPPARQHCFSCRSHHRNRNLALCAPSFSFSGAWEWALPELQAESSLEVVVRKDHLGDPVSTRECGGKHRGQGTK